MELKTIKDQVQLDRKFMAGKRKLKFTIYCLKTDFYSSVHGVEAKLFFCTPRIFQELFNKLDTIVSFVFCCYIFLRLGHKMTWHKKTTKKLLLEKLLAETLNCFGQSFLEASKEFN